MHSWKNKKTSEMNLKTMWQFCLFHTKGCPLIKPVIVIGAVSTAAVSYISSFLYARLLNLILAEEYSAAKAWAVTLVGAVLAATLLSVLSRQLFQFYIEPCDAETQRRTAEKIFRMEYEEFEKEETLRAIRRVRQGELGHGSIANQLTDIYEYFTGFAKVLMAAGVVLILFITLDFSSEDIRVLVGSSVILLLAFAGVLAMSKWTARKVGEANVRMNHANEQVNSLSNYLAGEMLNEKNAADIRLYQLSEYLMNKVRKNSGSFNEAYGSYCDAAGKLNGVMSFLFQLLAGLIYAYIALRYSYGSITAGEVLMYAGAIITMMDGIRDMTAKKTQIEYGNEYLKLYEEFISRPNMHYDGTLPIEKRDDNRYELEFADVSFSYPGSDNEILKNISLKFQIGEKLALVGLNGAGKTTLIKLLLRLYEPSKGRILLNGIDIGKYDYDEYMKIFAVVFQDYKLFDLPLDENIAGSEAVDEERVREVLEKVGLLERLSSMKNGIHTTLRNQTEEGENLSGGEEQKVAIARALYKDAPFIILDEPTAALDPVAEAQIYENFNELVGGKTAIYISHRMSSCRFCDRIIVLDKGSVTESGTHEELMKAGGIYSELYNAQAKYYT